MAAGAHAYRTTTTERSPAGSMKGKKGGEKNNVTPEKYKQTPLAKKTPGGYKFASLVVNQLKKCKNYHEHAVWCILSMALAVTFWRTSTTHYSTVTLPNNSKRFDIFPPVLDAQKV